MSPNAQDTVDLVTFTDEIFNGKLHFMRTAPYSFNSRNRISYLIESPKYVLADIIKS